MPPRSRAAPFLIAVTLLLTIGCAGYGIRKAPTEQEKQLNHQTQGAGEFIESEAESLGLEDIASAGSDVIANAKALAVSPIGSPESPKAYSPATSKELREDVEEGAERDWLSELVTAGGIAAAGGVALRIVGRYVPSLLGPAGGALKAVVEGIEIFNRSSEAGDRPRVDALLAQLKSSQERAGYREHVTRVVRRVRNGGGLPGSPSTS